jgi:hypothetical protein
MVQNLGPPLGDEPPGSRMACRSGSRTSRAADRFQSAGQNQMKSIKEQP